jgi:hypothetical protein
MIQVEIMDKGNLDKGWSNWFGGFGITHAAGNSILKGPVRDQSELRGILSRLADLGIDLISVNVLSDARVPKMSVRGGGEYKTKNSCLRNIKE